MTGSYRGGARRKFILVAWAFVTLVASLLVATPALADSYSIDAVNIDAAVASDGTLSVTETRDFVFDGSYHGVYWKIPKGENSSNGKDVGITINYVGLLVNGQVQKFDLSNSGGNSTYQVSDYGSYYQVKLYSAQEDDTAQFVISYNATGIVTRWDDTGELYWKFVSDGWDVESQNVTCTVTLPVPAGETVTAGDSVRAWGHGRSTPRWHSITAPSSIPCQAWEQTSTPRPASPSRPRGYLVARSPRVASSPRLSPRSSSGPTRPTQSARPPGWR